MARVPALLAALASPIALLAACSPFGGNEAFVCTGDAECQRSGNIAGRCEATGYCSFPSSACVAGWQYGGSSGPTSNQCVDGQDPLPDAFEPPMIDAVSPEAGQFCLGAGGLVEPCFAAPPTGALALPGGDLDTMTSPLCSTTVTNTTACVVAAGSISIAAGTTVRAVGARPLVLFAATTIDIAGTLDAASKRTPASLGAAANDATCAPGTNPAGSGGGAGGSFGGDGGNGGTGTNGGTAGTRGAAAATITLRGGCRGQAGAGLQAGAAGNGGGAVYAIAGTSIAIAAGGTINASGAGGGAGTDNSSGGGGGGAGGLIGLHAPAVTNAGTVFANGGGGGEGSGQQTTGVPGEDPVNGAGGVAGANGTNNGGNGGTGGGGGTANGGNGNNGNAGQGGAGGAGGGSVGAIVVFPAGQTLGGVVSPPPR